MTNGENELKRMNFRGMSQRSYARKSNTFGTPSVPDGYAESRSNDIDHPICTIILYFNSVSRTIFSRHVLLSRETEYSGES
jgi:hypothetical protein